MITVLDEITLNFKCSERYNFILYFNQFVPWLAKWLCMGWDSDGMTADSKII